MTKAELINEIKNRIGFDTDNEAYAMSKDERDFYTSILKVLEQEPCEDAVSRQAVHDWIKENTEYDEDHCDYFFVMRSSVMHKDIDELTSVTPKCNPNKNVKTHYFHDDDYCPKEREEE